MARNGSGTYNLPAGNPVVTGTTISSTTTNNTFNDIATALTGSISKDGQTTPTGNLPMGGFAHTGVADATVRAMYGTAGQIQDSAFTYLTSPAGTNAITATAALGMSAYVTGQRFFFVAPSTNTGACTININAIGAKSITKSGTTALVAGDIVSGSIVQVVYDGTQFQLLNPSLSALGTMSTQNANAVAITGGTISASSVTSTAGSQQYNNDGSGFCARMYPSSSGTQSIIQWVNYAGTVQWTSLVGTNGVLACSTPFSASSFSGAGTNLTGTANSLNAGIGVNQTWQSPSRSAATTYTNNTGKPIMWNLANSGSSSSGQGYVDGVLVFSWSNNGGNTFNTYSVIVPNGSTYRVNLDVGGIGFWRELA